MKVILLAVCAALFAAPAWGQDWAGTPTAGQLGNFPNYGHAFEENPSYTRTTTVMCYTPPVWTPPPCPANSSTTYAGYMPSSTYTNITTLPANISNANVAVNIQGFYADPASPSGLSTIYASVPLSSFATASSVSALSDKIDAFVAQQEASNQQAHDDQIRTQKGVAMASALSIMAPAPGATNRLALGTAAFSGQGAVSINYTHQSGGIDMSFAAAFSGNQTLGKAAVGVSW